MVFNGSQGAAQSNAYSYNARYWATSTDGNTWTLQVGSLSSTTAGTGGGLAATTEADGTLVTIQSLTTSLAYHVGADAAVPSTTADGVIGGQPGSALLNPQLVRAADGSDLGWLVPGVRYQPGLLGAANPSLRRRTDEGAGQLQRQPGQPSRPAGRDGRESRWRRLPRLLRADVHDRLRQGGALASRCAHGPHRSGFGVLARQGPRGAGGDRCRTRRAHGGRLLQRAGRQSGAGVDQPQGERVQRCPGLQTGDEEHQHQRAGHRRHQGPGGRARPTPSCRRPAPRSRSGTPSCCRR